MSEIAYSYLRFSSLEQKKGQSKSRQTGGAAEWSKRTGIPIDKSFRLNDEAISAFQGLNFDIGRLGAFVRAVEAGKIQKGSYLLLENLDRLSRDEIGNALELFLKIIRLGIRIVQLQPVETIFDRQSINNVAIIMMAIMELNRGHSESAMKSDRVGKAWKEKKRIAATKKMSKRCPGWMELSEDRTRFILIPAKAAVIRQIYRLYLSGIGPCRIAKQLNRENAPNLMAKAKLWHRSSVRKVLNSRSVIGEYQPHVGRNGNRKPEGDPIPNYYASVISEADFSKVQNLMRSKPKAKLGRTGRYSNLFTGICFDAGDKSPMHRIDKGQGCVQLVSSLASGGKGKFIAFPYNHFEAGFLHFLTELDPNDLREDGNGGALQDRQAIVEAEYHRVQKRLKDLEKALEDDGDITTIVKTVKKMEAKKKELEAERESISAAIQSASHNAFCEAQSCSKMLAESKDKEATRAKLKMLLRDIIERIEVKVWEVDANERYAAVEIYFANGLTRRMCLNVYRIYTGGGSTNPIPKQVCDVITGPTVSKEAFEKGIPELQNRREIRMEGLVHIGPKFAIKDTK